VKDLMEAGVTAQQLVPLGIGLVVSAVVGYLVIAWLLGFLRRQTMTVFVIYRLILAAVILATIVFRQS
ncbi:MAG TPA: undecaprenyl-diphosphate phosphatase, partial [Thermoanaerobaculia bacterium]|nr:undecaprenyl-diphosphate phosphatase [Thermoanaerobaculia bacterium]